MVFTSYLLFKISYILHEIMFFPIAWTSIQAKAARL